MIVALVVLCVAALVLYLILPRIVLMGVRAVNVKRIGVEGNMEKYLVSWLPSPSTFVDKHALLVAVNGGAGAIMKDDIPASATSADITVNAGDLVDVWVRTFGDNDTTADSLHVTFTAQNEESVQSVTGVAVQWKQHVP